MFLSFSINLLVDELSIDQFTIPVFLSNAKEKVVVGVTFGPFVSAKVVIQINN